LQHFKKAVTKNGYVRKFYEVIKTATQSGVVDRVFITGVSPVTLDSLTSGFNIITHLTTELEFHDMMGFTEAETSHIIDLMLKDKSRKDLVMNDLRKWYNGYLFYKKAKNRIYNSDMVLYFGKHFQRYQEYPDEMLDPNIAPDYGKLKAMFEIQDPAGNYAVLERILYAQAIEENLIIQFSFERGFSDSQFVSFLFYMGYLTIEGVNPMTGLLRFAIPNLVIKELYWDYFAWLLTERESLSYTEFNIRERVASMAMGNIESFLEMMTDILQTLSNRDYINFDEKYIKLVMIGFISTAGIYLPKSEYETPAGYADLLLVSPPQHSLGFEYLLELKYIKKSDASESHVQKTKAEAKKQILSYLESDPWLKGKNNLLAYTLVFVKDQLLVEKIQV
jgi:hypothetical protein